MTDAKSKTTKDIEEIRAWAEKRGGRPALVKSTEKKGSGVLRIDFGETEESLDEISWDELARIFDENDLEFLYQEETKDGKESRFFKFVRSGK